MLFGHVLKKHVDSVVRRVNKIKGNSNVRGAWRLIKNYTLSSSIYKKKLIF
jgi:hypothetical protein